MYIALVTVASLSKCWKPVMLKEANMLAFLAEEEGCCIPREQERYIEWKNASLWRWRDQKLL